MAAQARRAISRVNSVRQKALKTKMKSVFSKSQPARGGKKLQRRPVRAALESTDPLRVCPESSGWIAEFSEHEAD
jgi:hypothetical protein